MKYKFWWLCVPVKNRLLYITWVGRGVGSVEMLEIYSPLKIAKKTKNLLPKFQKLLKSVNKKSLKLSFLANMGEI